MPVAAVMSVWRVPGQGLGEPGRQLGHLGRYRGCDLLSRPALGQVDEGHETGVAFHDGPDRGVRRQRSFDQVALVVAGDLAVFDLLGSVVDRDSIGDA